MKDEETKLKAKEDTKSNMSDTEENENDIPEMNPELLKQAMQMMLSSGDGRNKKKAIPKVFEEEDEDDDDYKPDEDDEEEEEDEDDDYDNEEDLSELKDMYDEILSKYLIDDEEEGNITTHVKGIRTELSKLNKNMVSLSRILKNM